MGSRFTWRTAARTFGLIGILAQASACARATVQEGKRLDRTVITREQMLDGHYTTVYDAVAALRSGWLHPRGVDSFVAPSIVWVYVDGTRYGDVSVLQQMAPRLINAVRFYDGVAATGRWGVDNGSGVIHVSTWSDGDPGIPNPDSTRGPTKRPPR